MSWYRIWKRGRKPEKTNASDPGVAAQKVAEQLNAYRERKPDLLSPAEARAQVGLESLDWDAIGHGETGFHTGTVIAPLTPVSDEENEVLINGDELADGDEEYISPAGVAHAADLPTGYTVTIPVASVWKRKPPKKEVVRVERVWWMNPSLSEREARAGGTVDNGWTVRAVPVRGGRPIVADAQWFLDNYDNQA